MNKFFITILIVTSLSILYVFQQTKLLEHSYEMNSNLKKLTLLVDQNKALRYNIAKLEAPARLHSAMIIKEKTKDIMPVACYKVKIGEGLSVQPKEVAPIGHYAGVGRMLLSMFSLGNEAVADDLSE
jgi:hypothetical protein